jgi:diguanylate cyclase (GGDEF)-like protein
LHEKGYDPLTRILNRQAFDQVATDLSYTDKQISSSGTDRSFKAIAILDIDKFKLINDNYGHAIGDETLVLFAQTIRSVLRQDDLFFRYGGEEFVVLVKQAHSEEAFTALERCREAIEARRFPQVGQVTVSIGYADLTPKSQLASVLSKADKALYHIKKHGRNQVQSYEHLLAKGLLEEVKTIEGSADFWD